MTNPNVEKRIAEIAERNDLQVAESRIPDIEYLLALVKKRGGALETLRVAVNDKQTDPGAVAFIDRALNFDPDQEAK